jgi:hypothetical protein
MEIPPATAADAATAPGPGPDPLHSLSEKACAGDWVSECMIMYSRASRDGFRLQGASVANRQRAIQEARDAYKTLMKKKRAASTRSIVLRVVSITVGAIMAVVSVVVAIYCPPAVAGVGVAGGLISGSIGFGSAVENNQATTHRANAMLARQEETEAREHTEELLASMEQSVIMERRMAVRLAEMADAEFRANQAALRSMERKS